MNAQTGQPKAQQADQGAHRESINHNAETSSPLLLEVREAAALISVSRATFWRLHSKGAVPLPIRLSGRVVRWRRDELEAWVQKGCPPRVC